MVGGERESLKKEGFGISTGGVARGLCKGQYNYIINSDIIQP